MKSEIGFSPIKERIAQLIGNEEPFKWAKRVGISPATFDRMWNGGAMPKVDTLLRIASATGASLDWLVTGRESFLGGDGPGFGESHPAPYFSTQADEELFARVTDAVAKAHQEMGSRLPPIDLGRIVYRRYVEICSATHDPAERLSMVKLVKAQTLAELRAAVAAPGAGKASA